MSAIGQKEVGYGCYTMAGVCGLAAIAWTKFTDKQRKVVAAASGVFGVMGVGLVTQSEPLLKNPDGSFVVRGTMKDGLSWGVIPTDSLESIYSIRRSPAMNVIGVLGNKVKVRFGVIEGCGTCIGGTVKLDANNKSEIHIKSYWNRGPVWIPTTATLQGGSWEHYNAFTCVPRDDGLVMLTLERLPTS